MTTPPLMSIDTEKGIKPPANTSPKSSMKLGHVADKESSNWFVRLKCQNLLLSAPRGTRYPASSGGRPLQSFTHRLCADVNLLVLYQHEANNVAVGLLGPLAYVFSFVDSALCAAFGGMLGGAGAAYMSACSPQSGNQTMVVARFFMGSYHPRSPVSSTLLSCLG